ncbi:MAG TPA: PPC domain-containing protein, partial [Gemmataceae bacterium]|nr:PPC domain-containing protein [Gemmataceae bacterium]
TPFDLFGGWAGTVLLNTLREFQLLGAAGRSDMFDLYTVVLQEAGHVFGVGNSPRPESAMYTQYLGPRIGLDTTDVADIQTLYGARAPDRFESAHGNEVPATATKLRFVSWLGQLNGTDGTARRIPFVAAGDVTTLVDADVYAVKLPANAQSFTVALRTSGISLLTARVTVLDANGQVVASAVATDPTSGDLTITVDHAQKKGTYFVKVEGAADDVFGIGAYRLAVGSAAAEAVAPPNPSGLINDDGTGPRPAVFLGKQHEGDDRRWDFTYRASISAPEETDLYRVRTKKGTPGTLVVAVWAVEHGQLDPMATVYDKRMRPVPFQVLSDDDGSFTLQVKNARPNAVYFVRVGSSDAGVATNRGNYFLGIDFRNQAIELLPLAADRLTQAEPDVSAAMTVHQSQLFHFALNVVSANPQVESAARLIVLDEGGNEVYTVFAAAGRLATGDVLLGAGTYTLIITGGTRNPLALMPDLTFTLEGLVRSDPIGLTPMDPSGDPSQPPAAAPPPTTTTTGPYTGPYTNPYRIF